jgi:hypothetical protein
VLNSVTVQHLQENIQVAAGLAGEELSDLNDYQVDQASMDSGDLTDHEGTFSKQGRQVSTKKHFRYVGKNGVGDKRPAITPMHILGLAKLSQVCGNPARMSMPSWLCPNFSRNAGITHLCRWEQGQKRHCFRSLQYFLPLFCIVSLWNEVGTPNIPAA